MSNQIHPRFQARSRARMGLSVSFGALVTPVVASVLRGVLPAGAVPTSYYWGGEFIQAVRAGYGGYLLAVAGVFIAGVVAVARVFPRSRWGFLVNVTVSFSPVVWLGFFDEPLATLARRPVFPLWTSVTVLVFLLWAPVMYFLPSLLSFWGAREGHRRTP